MTEKRIRSIKGTRDILPEEARRWQRLEATLHNYFQRFGYGEIRTPVFEETSLFARSVGEETDIVSKEMYSWTDRNGTPLTLKPELTAPVARAFIQNNLGAQSPLTKLYYVDALFRRERPQKGRYRQFHQFGVEAFGSPHPEQDAEVIAIAWGIFKELGLSDLALKLNSVGSPACRDEYRTALRDFLEPHRDHLSETSRRRLETNPLRILDTKVPHERELLQDAPSILDFLTDEDREHFEQVKQLLDAQSIPYVIDSTMVRGLDYYTQTTFEITSEALGAQDALCGGGRYDGLVELLGGKPTPAIGFAAGIERLMLVIDAKEESTSHPTVDAYFVCLSEAARPWLLATANQLRNEGKTVEIDLLRRSLKAQLREANKLGAHTAVIVGDDEWRQKQAQVKDLQKGEQIQVPLDSLPDHFG